MRVFATGFFAVVALGTSALLTPWLGLPLQRAIGMPFLATVFACVWAWLLYPRTDAVTYGASRGVAVALLAYLTLVLSLAAPAHRETQVFLILGFVWTPFPWLVLAVGAAAGSANLHKVRQRVRTSTRFVRRIWTVFAAVVRTTYGRLDRWATDTQAHASVTRIVSACLLFAGGVLGLACFPPEPMFADADVEMVQRLLPGIVALVLAMVGWTAARLALAAAPAARRLRITLISVALAGIAAAWFASNIVV